MHEVQGEDKAAACTITEEKEIVASSSSTSFRRIKGGEVSGASWKKCLQRQM